MPPQLVCSPQQAIFISSQHGLAKKKGVLATILYISNPLPSKIAPPRQMQVVNGSGVLGSAPGWGIFWLHFQPRAQLG